MNYKIRRTLSFLIGIFFFLLAVSAKENLQAQFTANDTAYLNNFFTEVPYISYWNKPGTWFTNNEISSVQDYFNQMDSNFKFFNHEYSGCYKNILIESDIILDTQINFTFNTFEQVNNLIIYGIPNPFAKVKFSLNNKSAYTYFVLDSTTNLNQDCTVAYMVVPGTGPNAMSTFVQGTGYHNLYCQVRNNLKQFGDVYSMSRANEDHRAIFFNKKKLGTITPIQPTFMQSYLNAANRSYGVNQLIETVAMIKFLKTKYDKVFVLGLSTGGKVALWSSMEAEPHAALISSGYTILADLNYQTQLINSYSFGNFLLDLDKDSTEKRLSELKTQFMFTWGNNDNYLAQLEVDSNLTQNYFQGLNNTSYFYNYNSHTFPPCYAIDSFFQRSKNKSTCKLDYNKTNCNKDSVIIYAQFCGNPPYTFNLVRDSLIISSHVSNTNNDTFIVYESGNYEIRNVIDANYIQGFSSDRLNVLKSPQVSGVVNFKNYLCDSSLTRYDLISTGQSPWVWHFLKDNVQDSLLISNDSIHVNLQNGDYVFTTIIDSNNCIFNLFDTLSINNSNLSATLSTPMYNCDSNKTHLQVNLTGNGPWMVTYTYNGINQQYTTSQAQSDLYLLNGTYQFISVQDATGCNAMINAVYTFSYQTLQASMSTPMYNCDSNKTEIAYNLQGNSPFTLQYVQNSQVQQALYASTNPTAYYSNGQYDFQTITDATGCVTNLNQSYTWNYDTISATLTTPMYNCDSNKTHLQVNLTGNGPWMVEYTYNGINQQYTTSQAQSDLYLPNGTYQFISVQDATGCSAMINAVYTFSYQALQASMSTPMYNCDSNKTEIAYSLQGNSPFTLQYVQNNQVQHAQYVGSNPKSYYINGQYDFQTITDATGCVTNLNQSYTWNYDTISATLSTPMYNCDSNKTHLQVNLTGNGPWVVAYTYNGINQQYTTSQAQSDLYLPNGTYQFISVQDATGCSAMINNVYTFSYQALQASMSTPMYNCDSNKTEIAYNLQGNSPFTLQYMQNSQVQQAQYVSSNPTAYYSNGQYDFQTITDATGCVTSLNQSYTWNYDTISATLSTPMYNCDSNKTHLQLNLTGNGPWMVEYVNTITGLPYTVSSNQNVMDIYFTNGIYQVTTVTDQTQCQSTINQIITNLYSPLTFQKLNESFECDSNKVKIDYQFGGDFPWTILIKNLVTGITSSSTYNQNNVSLYFETGQYSVVSVSDIKCGMPINDTFVVNFPSLQATLSPPYVNCDSGKYQTNIQISSGLKPFKLKYTKDNVTTEFNTNTFSSNLILPNSTYYFDYISDSTGCKYPLNSTFQAEYIPFKYNSLITTYNCEKDSTAVEFDINGKDSISLVYLKNGVQLDTLLIHNSTNWITTNGDYKLSYMYDKEGCIDTLDFNLSIDNQRNTMLIDSIHPDCVSKVYELDFIASGASPWTIYYNKLNNLDSILINSSISTQQFSNGIFNFLEAKDSNGCMYRIDSVVVLQPFLNFTPFLQTNFIELFVQHSNNRYYWYQNNNIIDTISMHSIKVNGDGEYYVAIIDSAGCTYESNKLNIEFPELISLYPNPATKSTSLLVDADFDGFWSYSILDMSGKLIDKQVVYQKYKILEISNLAIGSYNIVIEYNKDLKKEKQVLRFIKE
jgi:hypothetical protein